LSRLLWILTGILAALLLAGSILLWMPTDTNTTLNLSEAPTGGDFSLDSAKGPFHLKDQRGKVVLIYFGYTFCPDVCPTNLAMMAQALNALSEEELQQVQGVFVSVDPERDSLEHLATYTDHFHPSIVGVTGAPDNLLGIAQRYGSIYRKVEGEPGEDYLVDHSSNTYVVAPDGSLHTALPHAAPPQQILEVTRKLLAQPL
jgi:protein SCO1/2